LKIKVESIDAGLTDAEAETFAVGVFGCEGALSEGIELKGGYAGEASTLKIKNLAIFIDTGTVSHETVIAALLALVIDIVVHSTKSG
jgi:hypothetical protein